MKMTGCGVSMNNRRYIRAMVYALNNGRHMRMTRVGAASGKKRGDAG
jgi:hypothetical protein